MKRRDGRERRRHASARASCNGEPALVHEYPVMTDYRGINSLFNQQTASPACCLSNKIWRPCPGADQARSWPPLSSSLRAPTRSVPSACIAAYPPSSIGRPRSRGAIPFVRRKPARFVRRRSSPARGNALESSLQAAGLSTCTQPSREKRRINLSDCGLRAR